MRSPPLWQRRQQQRVVWIGARAPDEDEEQALLAATEHGLHTYGEISRYVADALVALDLARVGPTADIGIFRAWYLAGACRVLERLNGDLIAIGEPPGIAPAHVKAG